MAGIIRNSDPFDMRHMPDDDRQSAPQAGDPPLWTDDAPPAIIPAWDDDEDPEPDYEREYMERKKQAIQDFTDFGL